MISSGMVSIERIGLTLKKAKMLKELNYNVIRDYLEF